MADGAHSISFDRYAAPDLAQPARSQDRKPGHRGPMFIVGMPRSGTKLLRGLLNQSPGVHVLDIETDFFPFLVRWVREHGLVQTSEQFENLHAAMRSAPYFSHRQSTPPFVPEEWRKWCERYDAGGLFEGFVRYETNTVRDDNHLWGDKSPAYIRHIELLFEHFPDARIVHLVRDVRDHCVSIRKAWSKDVRRAAYLWGRDVGKAHRLCQADPDRCLQLRYEDLLRSPEEQMRRLCGFLSIDFVEAMTRLNRPVEHLGDATGSTEIVQDNFGKFMERLSPREIRDIESLAFDTMRMLGLKPVYARRQRTMGALEQKLRRIKDGLRLVAKGKIKLGIAGAMRFHWAQRRLAN
jgi:hypothetical protein